MKKLLFVFFLCALPILAQGVRFGDGFPVSEAQTPGGPVSAAANAAITICTFPANAVPCTNKAITFTDQTLGTACPTSTQITLAGTNACVGTTDGYGNWGVWVAGGTNYAFTITLTTGQSLGPYTVSVPFTGQTNGTVQAMPQYSIPAACNSGIAPVICGTNMTTDPTLNNQFIPGYLQVGPAGGPLLLKGALVNPALCPVSAVGSGNLWGFDSSTGLMMVSYNGGACADIGSGGGSSFPVTTSVAVNSGGTVTVNTGGSIVPAGSGVINATELGSATFAAPGPIGSTTPSTGAFSALSATGGITATADGTHAGIVGLVGNTANPSLPSNTDGFLGPGSSATFTDQFFQFPASVPGAAGMLGFGAPSGTISPFVYYTLQGNGTKAQLSTGSTTTNDCVKFDANGNTVDNGSSCSGSSGLSGMAASQVPIAATASTVTSSKAIQGTDTDLLSSGTVSGTGASLCTDANGGATTSGCSGGVSAGTYFYTPGYASATITASANVLVCGGVVIPPGGLSVGHIAIDVIAGDNTNNTDMGFYNASGTKIAFVGAAHQAGTSNQTFAFSGGTQTIPAGKNYFCFTSAASTYSMYGVGNAANFYPFTTTAITSSGGALPSTITPPADNPGQAAGNPQFVLLP